MTSCNICGDSTFLAGPFGRMSFGGRPPRCATCSSLERHRAMRDALDRMNARERFSTYRLIRFSPDPTVEDAWFQSAETSIYEGNNSLDIQSIDRADGAYDVVMCSHVLEHVKDDKQALRELVRILSPQGFLVMAVPHTEDSAVTDDWGFANPTKNLHYRAYGRDFDTRIASIVAPAHAFSLEPKDPATGDLKRFQIITKSDFWRDRVKAL
jgi:SAM-dependent methyltransferase